MVMKKRTDIIEGFFFAFGLLFLILAACPYSFLKPIADSAASDGNLERFSPAFWTVLRLIFAGLFLILAGLFFWKRSRPESWNSFFRSLGSLPFRCIRDIKPFFHDLGKAAGLKNREFWAMVILFLVGSVLRIIQVRMPLLHDEAYSMAIWGRSDLLYAISDYHLPNNHVLNSLLINLIYHYVGKSPALLRLPVLVSGCLLIPAVWLLGRLFYRGSVGLIAAGLTAFAPFLVFYSVNARGYEIQAFLSVLTIGLAVYGKRTGNIFSWFLLLILSALNFFTLPVALYPFGGICVWLFVNVIFYHQENCAFRNRLHMFKYLIFAGLCVSALTMLLYVPLLRFSGWDSFFGNIYIGGVESSAFVMTMLSRLIDNVKAFTDTLPLPVTVFVTLGLIISPFVFTRSAKETVSYGAALVLWMSLVIPFQKPNLWPRTLLFLHPFLLLFIASGLYSGLRLLPCGTKIAGFVCSALVLAACISQFYAAREIPGKIGPDERAVRIIMDREGENASNIHFVTAAQDNAPIWIYADAYDLPRSIFDKRHAFNTVYAFVNPLNDAYLGPKDLNDLLERFGPGNNFFDSEKGEILMDEPDGILYRFEGREGAIRKGYGEYPDIAEDETEIAESD